MNTNTALLVMDMQMAILKNYPHQDTLVAKVHEALTFAREKNIPVIYVIVGFREGAPEISMNNKSFTLSRERYLSISPEEFMRIEPTVAPQGNEVVVTKRRFSAFTGSDLEVVLRAHGIGHLVLSGISTSGVVLSTLREAADKDYRITVLEDCCGDGDEEVHRVLTTKVFTRQADVMKLEEWMK